eukprot:3490512-Rhodomonas_salina.2
MERVMKRNEELVLFLPQSPEFAVLHEKQTVVCKATSAYVRTRRCPVLTELVVPQGGAASAHGG